MIETNIRIVYPGSNLYVHVRCGTVSGPDLSPDLLARACGSLRYRHGLAAVVQKTQPPSLLVATSRPIQPVHLEQEEWELDVADGGGPNRQLRFSDPDGQELLPPLVERTVIAQVARQTQLWSLDSPRIWYEPEPFRNEQGIAAHRRYEIAALPIEGVGIGVAVDIGTAFFSTHTLAYFFDPDVPEDEQERRGAQFRQLAARQQGQKGTLLYDNGRSRSKCYFEGAPSGVTCATTGKIRVKGQTYASLLAYYQSAYPGLPITGDDVAVRVSFPGLERPQWVAAKQVRARVMNEDVPEVLASVDKIRPAERRDLIREFWVRLGRYPLGQVAPGLQDGFWRPDASRIIRLLPKSLAFGQNQRLAEPTTPSAAVYRAHYRQRLEHLEKAGCYSVPPAMTRTLHCAYPGHLDEETCRRFATDLAAAVSSWSGITIAANPISYDSVADAVEKLRDAERGGTVLFILNEEPAAYHEAAFQLTGWRLKRVTERTLTEHYRYLSRGAWDKRARSLNMTLGQARWDSFVNLNALDILQQLDAVPFRIDQAGPYQAQLVIDVGHDRRHFALSLLIARDDHKSPSFLLITHVYAKPDQQHEAINEVMLADQLVKLIDAALPTPSDPIESLLVFRDGLLYHQEISGIDRAIARLVSSGKLAIDARIDMAEIHKGTQKALRIWEVDKEDIADNPLEGSVLRLNGKMVLITATGAATLHQGTAEPFLVTGNGRCSKVVDAAVAAFEGSQLNWSSPSVAQRLTLPMKRADDELSARSAQEIRRLR